MTRLLAIVTAGLVVTGIAAVTSAGAPTTPPDLGEPAIITSTEGDTEPARRVEQPDVLTTEDDDSDPDGPGPTSDNKASWITRVSRDATAAAPTARVASPAQDAPSRDVSVDPPSREVSVDAPTGDATAGD